MRTTITYSYGDPDEGQKYIEFDYEVKDEDVNECITHLFKEEFKIGNYKIAYNIIDEFDMWDDLFDRYEDLIKENFHQEAWEYYENRNKSPYDIYGISESDFH